MIINVEPRSQSGTVLIYFLAAMAIVSMLVEVVVRPQANAARASSESEFKAVSEALALSGIELMSGVQATPAANGLFLTNRARAFTMTTADNSLNNIFRIVSPITPTTQYTPPLEYPPLRDIAPAGIPAVVQPTVIDNDINLPIVYPFLSGPPPPGATPPNHVPAPPTAFWSWVGGTGPVPASAAWLPTPNMAPRTTEIAAAYTSGNGLTPTAGVFSYYRITGLQPTAGLNSALNWCGPNAAFPITYQGNAAKLPPPSFIIVRDPPLNMQTPPGFYRWFIYCWTATFGGATPYLVSSGRVRQVYVTQAGLHMLGAEAAVSNTQIR